MRISLRPRKYPPETKMSAIPARIAANAKASKLMESFVGVKYKAIPPARMNAPMSVNAPVMYGGFIFSKYLEGLKPFSIVFHLSAYKKGCNQNTVLVTP